jgi:MFS transporter, DHA2 family, methylenomycin A resistance protein
VVVRESRNPRSRFGAGFGTMIPGTTNVAMRDLPPGVSGAASGVWHASRQIGTSVGLAVLGAIGVHAAVSDWNARTGRFPASIRARAPGQAQNVGGARIDAVTKTLGSAYRHPAAQAFVHGYHLAVGVGAVCLLAAAVVAVSGFRRPSSPPPPEAPLPLPWSEQPARTRITHAHLSRPGRRRWSDRTLAAAVAAARTSEGC